MRTRFPFQYGIASMTSVPHLFVTAKVLVDGKPGTGRAADGLPPKWFTKVPDTTFEEDLPEMLDVIRNAAGIAQSIPLCDCFFDWWQELYKQQAAWAKEREIPPLLANFGVSLVERATLDAFCRTIETPFVDVLQTNVLGIRLGEVYAELENKLPRDLISPEPPSKIVARHTIGLGDPLSIFDIDEPLDDGLPYALTDCIATYGLTHFKIKVCGNIDTDLERLAMISRILESESSGNYWITLDGNEQYHDLAGFQEDWNILSSNDDIRLLFKHILFIEQPIHRDFALSEPVSASQEELSKSLPIIIDESDCEIGSVVKALELGYSGTSHKNCKGIIKGIANAALLENRRRTESGKLFLLSGEDLGSVGPLAVVQDLMVAAVLGIKHVERNGHHYFKGLSMMPESIQSQMLESHGDIYRKHEEGFPALDVLDGKLSVDSLLKAPFGVGPLIDVSEFVRLEDWDGVL